MRPGVPSSTSLLIARALLLAEATPELRPLLVGESAVIVRRLLASGGLLSRFGWALRFPLWRRVLQLAERIILPGILLHWLVRKRLLDDLAHEALTAGCRQIVVLGAGLDTLAWRLRSEAATFELDFPASQTLKRETPGSKPVQIPADLLHASAAEALRAEPTFHPNAPTLYVAEGLLMYLPAERVVSLFRELAALSAPGGHFAFTFMEAQPGKPIGFAQRRHSLNLWLRRRGEPFRWALAREHAAAFALENGWELQSLSSPEEFRQRYLTPLHLEHRPLAVGETVALATLRTA